MLEGYFDESEADGAVFCVSGYLVLSGAVKRMEKVWVDGLPDAVPYFHMSECAHGTGHFADMSKKERARVVKRCIAAIKNYTIAGFSMVVRKDLFENYDDAYSRCVEYSVDAIKVFLNVHRIEDDVALIFEAGHEDEKKAKHRVAHKWAEFASSLTFKKKGTMRLLEAADLLAWQARKYVKDRVSGERPPRKDFLSLMEHPHFIFYMEERDGEGTMASEMWPMSRRIERTESLTIDTDGPVTFLRAADDPTPIIPIRQSDGWRLGGNKLLYVAFEDLAGKRFALGFDEQRVIETIYTLVAASRVWSVPEEAITEVEAVDLAGWYEGEPVIAMRLASGRHKLVRMPIEIARNLGAAFVEAIDEGEDG